MKENLSQFTFGVPAAERDDDLYTCFVSSEIYANLREGKKTIVLGNRGSGKSALFRMLAEEEKKRGSLIISLAPEEYSYELLSITMKKEAQGSWAKQGAYSAAWKYLIYILLMKEVIKTGKNLKKGAEASLYSYLRDNHAGTDTNPVGMMVSYLKRMEGLKIGQYEAAMRARELKKLYSLEELESLIPKIDEVAGNRRIFVFVDELDKGWDASEDAMAFVAGLFHAALAINERLKKVRVLVSLRRELYDNIPALYEDAQKVRDIIETIQWDEASLLELIGRRIARRLPHLVGLTFENLWNAVFVETLEYRQTKSFNYVVDRTLYRPREIIQFCNDIAETTHRQIIPTSEPFNYKQVAEAEYAYSEARLKDICSEYRFQYPGLQSVMETFRGSVYTFTREELADHLLRLVVRDLPVDKDASSWCEDVDPETLLEILWKVGFLRAQAVGGLRARRRSGSAYLGSHQISSLNLRNLQRFHVHPMFRSYLGMKESKREPGKVIDSDAE
jgi:energy-coupling factor transporter ATP-binding protein EcfA2